jgi:N-methylhydantoinase B
MSLTYPNGDKYKPTTKDLVHGVPAGTIYYQEAGGGGGCGDPKKRKTEKVLEDVRNGKVSLESAKTEYGVVIDSDTWTVDEAATAKLRG